MQRLRLSALILFLLNVPMGATGADLLPDEQGPTAAEAVSTFTAGEDFLTPSYIVPAETKSTSPVPSEVDILNEIFGTSTLPESQKAAARPSIQTTFTPSTNVEKTGKKPLLTPLPPLPDVGNISEAVPEPKKVFFKRNGLADQALAVAAFPVSGIGMPREIRITFYAGQSTFSAQALKWVRSFAVRVVNDPRLLVEIRVSEQDWKVQEKRLSILLQILKEEGVSAHQIRIYKSDREPENILIGYAQNSAYTMGGAEKASKEIVQKTIDW